MIVLKNGFILLPEGLRKTNLGITDGTISYIGPGSADESSSDIIDIEGKYLLPGFIDIHTNGIAGFDFTNGLYDYETGNFTFSEGEYLDGLEAASRAYLRTGVTRAVLTSLAAPLPQLKTVFRLLFKYKSDHVFSPWNEVISGINIEGTFIKLVSHSGAHNPEYFNAPSVSVFDELQEAAGGLITIVNVAPEWNEPALRLFEYLSSRNIVCAAGHTGATGDQYSEAIKSGLRLAVHFLNGPTGSSAKSFSGGGAVEGVLRADEVFAELIVDGYHVDKSYVMDTIKRKGFDKTIAITDSMFAAASRGLKDFQVLGVHGAVSRNGEYLLKAGRENSLFGSMLTMDAAFSNILTWLTMPIEGVWNKVHYPFAFEDALVKTSALCSKNPAMLLGIYESGAGQEAGKCTGSIETGKKADVLIAGIEYVDKRFNLEIDRVITGGVFAD